MDEKYIREQIHHAVDAHGASRQDDPYLAQRILAQAHRKEALHMKKLSTGMIVAIVLMLLSVTALAVGLTVEEKWKQSFDRMNTTGKIPNLSDESQAEITMDEAIAIARETVIARYGTSAEELDAMGVYPAYYARGWDGQVFDDPSEWQVYFSSRTDVNLDLDYTDYGPTGEYRVYINAETREIIYCNWYTNRFWDRAQTIWDCGSYDVVYEHYQRALMGEQSFYSLPLETQAYWTKLLAEKGYEIVGNADTLHEMLLQAHLDLQFCELYRVVSNDIPLVAAAWEALEASTGLSAERLQGYAYVATLPDWQTGYDNVCIHFAYNLEWDMLSAGYLDRNSDLLFTYASQLGMYMVSFDPGTTSVAAITHVTKAETSKLHAVTEGGLFDRTAWTPEDFLAFDAAYTRLERAVQRMQVAGMADSDIRTVVLAYREAVNAEDFSALTVADQDKWFAESSEWDAQIVPQTMTYTEFKQRYGTDQRFWPQEVLMANDPRRYRMPHEGELSAEEAIQRAIDQLLAEQGENARTDLGDYTLVWHRVSLTDDPTQTDCRWEIYITDDPSTALNGWKITFGDWGESRDTPTVQHITDQSNG